LIQIIIFYNFNSGGATGNAQFPVMYAVGPSNYQYSLFVDSLYRIDWNFQGDPYTLSMWWSDAFRFYMILGDTLPQLRSTYMDIVGRAPIPPKKVFGFWSGEYNLHYDSVMMFNKIKGLHAAGFPTDGVMLDVQWFGGVTEGSDNSNMGLLQFSSSFLNNRDVRDVLGQLDSLGLGAIPIEESYVAKNNNYSQIMQSKCYFARNDANSCSAVYFSKQAGDNCWWGNGYYIDWSNEDGGAFWHDQKRQPLAELGVVGTWTDLGEPEMFRASAVYNGFDINGQRKNREADVHNSYNLMWHKSIWDGYWRNKTPRRNFQVSRSGTSGLQRFGASMWSGDIGSNFNSLGAHFNAQMHISFSGIDYFGCDIGGFHREALDGDLNVLYTRWYANSMWIDFPARAHTENLCDCKQVTPDKIGDVPSNLHNTLQRYELVPYYYTLAYRAFAYGEPVVPALPFYFQNDANTRSVGHQKLIGKDLMFGIIASYDEYDRGMYLPKGEWINYQTNEYVSSTGMWVDNVPLFEGERFQLPAYAKAGAIIPKANVVAGQTWNVFGLQSNGKYNTDLIIRVYQSTKPELQSSQFTIYDDDGTSFNYMTQNEYSLTPVAAFFNNNTIYVGPTKGGYKGMPMNRVVMLEYVVKNQLATAVTFNGVALPQLTSMKDYLAATEGFFNDYNIVYAKSKSSDVTAFKNFQVTLTSAAPKTSIYFTCRGNTVPGEELYVVGNSPTLGNWVVAKSVQFEPNMYPLWTIWVHGFSETVSTIEWKCAKRKTDGTYVYSKGSNNVFKLTNPDGGYQGMSTGVFFE